MSNNKTVFVLWQNANNDYGEVKRLDEILVKLKHNFEVIRTDVKTVCKDVQKYESKTSVVVVAFLSKRAVQSETFRQCLYNLLTMKVRMVAAKNGDVKIENVLCELHKKREQLIGLYANAISIHTGRFAFKLNKRVVAGFYETPPEKVSARKCTVKSRKSIENKFMSLNARQHSPYSYNLSSSCNAIKSKLNPFGSISKALIPPQRKLKSNKTVCPTIKITRHTPEETSNSPSKSSVIITTDNVEGNKKESYHEEQKDSKSSFKKRLSFDYIAKTYLLSEPSRKELLYVDFPPGNCPLNNDEELRRSSLFTLSDDFSLLDFACDFSEQRDSPLPCQSTKSKFMYQYPLPAFSLDRCFPPVDYFPCEML